MAPEVLDRCLTTSADAATAYRAGVEALGRHPEVALNRFAHAVALDPTFALAHAALALLGHEQGAAVDVHGRITAALLHARRSSPSERRQVCAVAALVDAGVSPRPRATGRPH